VNQGVKNVSCELDKILEGKSHITTSKNLDDVLVQGLCTAWN